ncbi:hypothetical protein BGZ54_003901 [Gamsiella multidivaricata]|nr:hypothetical protein BGZ54_003901 [Gamsiella multidivaricata]
MELQAQRHSNLATSTENMYSRYQLHWRGYTDHLVFSKRFQVYMAENLAENLAEETDEDEEEEVTSGAQAGPLGKTDRLPSYETVDAHIKAACESQKADPSNVAMHSESYPRSKKSEDS